jgi:hypothetical protein
MSGTWASGWATGDVVTAAEFAKGVGSIYDTTLGIASASIDVTPIVGTYAHLIFELSGRGDAAATNVSVWVRYNNDSGANYDSQYVARQRRAARPCGVGRRDDRDRRGDPGRDRAVERVRPRCGATSPATPATIGQKSGVVAVGAEDANASGGLTSYAYAHWWRSTAAITRITLLPSSGNFVGGTRLTIYAMGA